MEKLFRGCAETSVINSLNKNYSLFFGKKFQNWGYFVKKKKMFRKFVETSVIISLNIDNSPYFGKNFKKFFKLKKIQL